MVCKDQTGAEKMSFGTINLRNQSFATLLGEPGLMRLVVQLKHTVHIGEVVMCTFLHPVVPCDEVLELFLVVLGNGRQLPGISPLLGQASPFRLLPALQTGCYPG